MSAYLTVLTIIPTRFQAYPYVILLVICLEVFTVFFLKYPSLRTVRKKRILLVYSALALICGLLGYQAYDIYFGDTYVSFGVSNTSGQLCAGKTNQLTISSSADGIKQVSCELVVRCTNATFEASDQQNYIKLNDTAVKISFNLSGMATQEEPVLFRVNHDSASFEFMFSLEAQSGTPMLVVGWVSQIIGVWNATTGSYALNVRHAP